MQVEELLLVEVLPAKTARPLRWTVLLFGAFLRREQIPARMERTLKRQLDVIFLENWREL